MKLPAGIIRDEMHMQTQGTCGAAAMMRVEQNFLIGNSNKNRIPESQNHLLPFVRQGLESSRFDLSCFGKAPQVCLSFKILSASYLR